ncbi:hypothetical protein RDABS01_001197 [Bienertia sinuspersici]
MPFTKRNMAVAKEVGDSMGGFIEYDETNSLCLDSFMRIKVNIDVDKPLRRGFKIATMQNGTKWVDIKYERLGDFCFYCGRIGHIDRDCSFIKEDEEMRKSLVYKYGPWLKASPLKRNKLPKQEYEKEKNLLGKLYVQATNKENKVTDLEVKRLGPPSLARKALFQNSGGHNQVASRGKENTVESSGDSSSWCNIGEEDEGVGELNKEMQKVAVGKAPKWRRRTRSLGRKESVASSMEGGRVNIEGNSGGMGFWWKDIEVTVVSYSRHHFEADVLDHEGRPMWRAVGIYGWPESDLGYKGSCFTWRRGQSPDTLVQERLDRFLADEEWRRLFKQYEVRHYPTYKSDHSLICLEAFSHEKMERQERRGACELEAPEKLRLCADKLGEWAAAIFGDIKRKIRQKERELKKEQCKEPDHRAWNKEVIWSFFNEEEARAILAIPLSASLPSDSLFWWPNKNGEYTVKSGYWLAKQGSQMPRSDPGSENKLWSKIWNLNGPPKLRHFLWQACKGSLPVMERLRHRHITMNAMCPICNEEEETIIHAIFECSNVREIWQHRNL